MKRMNRSAIQREEILGEISRMETRWFYLPYKKFKNILLITVKQLGSRLCIVSVILSFLRRGINHPANVFSIYTYT